MGDVAQVTPFPCITLIISGYKNVYLPIFEAYCLGRITEEILIISLPLDDTALGIGYILGDPSILKHQRVGPTAVDKIPLRKPMIKFEFPAACSAG